MPPVCHQTGRLLRTNQTFPPHSPSPNRGPFSRGRRRSTPVAPGVPAGRLYAASRVPPLSPVSGTPYFWNKGRGGVLTGLFWSIKIIAVNSSLGAGSGEG